MQNEKKTSRRAFVQRLLGVGAASLGAGVLLSACGGGSNQEEQGGETAAACTPDLSGLTAQEKALRENFEYVSDSPYPDKTCSNCQFYTAPKAGATCGGCQLFPGPVAAKGYCNSWVASA